MSIAVTALMSIMITFMQLGFFSLDTAGGLSIYVNFLLIPVSVTAFLLGTPAAVAIGLWSGVLLYIHSLVMPLDFQELLIPSVPLVPIVCYGAVGLVAGVALSPIESCINNRKRTVSITALGCLATSILWNVGLLLFPLNTSSPVEVVLQILANDAIVVLACYASYVLFLWERRVSSNLGVRQMLVASIYVGVAVASMTTVTVSFVAVTLSELQSMEELSRSEANYICLQLKYMSERAQTFERLVASGELGGRRAISAEDYRLLSDPVGNVLEGYTMEQMSTVMIVSDNHGLITEDKRLSTWSSVRALFGDEVEEAVRKSVDTADIQRIIYNDKSMSKDAAKGYVRGTQIAYLLARRQGNQTVVLIEPSNVVFKDRAVAVLRQIILTVALVAVVYRIVAFLLGSLVDNSFKKANEALTRITLGDFSGSVDTTGPREFKLLSEGINKTVTSLKYLIAEAENRITGDLGSARAIQEGALPRDFPAFPDVPEVDLYASMDAAKQVGGDFYDFFTINDHTVGFLVADVSGKGIPAALFMMAAKTEIQNSLSKGLNPAQALAAAEAYLCAHNEAKMFVTVWAATLDWRSGVLSYVNAGHNYPLLRHGRGGAWEWIKEGTNNFLGWFGVVDFEERTLMLAPGDELLLYTDGVNEAFNERNEPYGNERLEAFLADHADERPRELVDDLRTSVYEWAGEAEQSDDVTILAVEYKAQG